MPHKDPEVRRQYMKEYYRKNGGRIRQQASEYYQKHKEKIKKWSGENKDILKERWATGRIRGKARLLAAKEGKPCTDCGRVFPSECMDFDHVRGEKKRGVGLMGNQSDKVFYEEVAKCELVCANCHRVRTHEWREQVAELKQNFMKRMEA